MSEEEQIRGFNHGKSLFELEHQLEAARTMFYESILDDTQDKEMKTKYLNAYKLASDMFYARKWSESPVLANRMLKSGLVRKAIE